MLGIGKNKGKITLCDDNIIKENNINNNYQIFFNEKNLSKKKLKFVKNKILNNNNENNINLIYNKINEENDKKFSNKIWNEFDLIICAIVNKNKNVLKYLNKIRKRF